MARLQSPGPLQWNARIVNPDTGYPTPDFMRWFTQLMGNDQTTAEAASSAATAAEEAADTATWGEIDGVLSDQSDLQAALDALAGGAGSAFAFEGGSAAAGGRGFVLDGGASGAVTGLNYWIDGGLA